MEIDMETAPPPRSLPLVMVEVAVPSNGEAVVQMGVDRSSSHAITASLDVTSDPTRVLLAIDVVPLAGPSAKTHPPPAASVPTSAPSHSAVAPGVLTPPQPSPASPISESLCEVSFDDEDGRESGASVVI